MLALINSLHPVRVDYPHVRYNYVGFLKFQVLSGPYQHHCDWVSISSEVHALYQTRVNGSYTANVEFSFGYP